jgi:Tfp pilus assembly ATPase PilU
MQDFDTVIKGLIEKGTISVEDGLNFATNQNNLLLTLRGVTGDEFTQRDVPVAALSDRESMLSMID